MDNLHEHFVFRVVNHRNHCKSLIMQSCGWVSSITNCLELWNIYRYTPLVILPNRWFTIVTVVKTSLLRVHFQPRDEVPRSSAPSTLTKPFLLRESVHFNVDPNDTQIGWTVEMRLLHRFPQVGGQKEEKKSQIQDKNRPLTETYMGIPSRPCVFCWKTTGRGKRGLSY